MLASKRRRLEDAICDFPDKPFTEEELDYLYLYTGELLELHEQQTRSELMSIQQAILFAEKGVIPLKEYVEALSEHYPTAVGFAYIEDNGIKVAAMDPGADGVMENLKICEDSSRLVWFGKSVSKILDEDVQPLTLLEKDGKIILAVAGEGNFDEYARTGSSHPPFMHYVNDKLRPRMLKKFKGNGDDIDELMKELGDDEDTQTEMAFLIPNHTSVVFLASNGKFIPFLSTSTREKNPKDNDGKELGFSIYAPPGEAKKAPEPAPAPAANSGKKTLSGLRTAAATPTATEGNKIIEKIDKDSGKGPILATNRNGTGPIEVPANAVLEAPPASVDNKDKLTTWYTERVGYRPQNWKERPSVVVKNVSAVKLADLKDTTAADALKTAAAVNTEAKKTEATHIPPPRLLAETMRKHLLEHSLPKVLGANSELIANPLKILDDESKIASIAGQLGKTGIKDLYIPHAGRCQLLKEAGVEEPRWQTFFSGIWGDFINSHGNQEKKIIELENRLKSAEAELAKAKPAEEPAKTEPTKRTLSAIGRVRG